jgi:Fe-S cluster assembly protein SufD
MSFIDRHPEFLATAAGPDWLCELRNTGIQRFAELGFPTTKDEDWRFTDVTPIKQATFTAPGPGDCDVPALLQQYNCSEWSGHRMVFIDGRYSPDQSAIGALPAGVTVDGLAAVLAANPATVQPHLTTHAGKEASPVAERNGNPFTALNTGYIEDGAAIIVPDNVDTEVAVNVFYISTAATPDAVTQPRTLVVAGKHSKVTVTENYLAAGDGAYFTNAVTEVALAANANVDHYKVQRESYEAYHMAAMYVHAGRDSHFASHSITLGGAISRNTIAAQLDDENIECTLNGLYLGQGRQLIDNHTCIEHAKPNCNSYEIYKGIVDDKARAVFNGRIHVWADAQKTDALQTNRTLLLSDDARINTKPELEIYADDVRCTHGATVGQLDEKSIFYLRSRGIDKTRARAILTYAFACEAIANIALEPVRATIEQVLVEKFRH